MDSISLSWSCRWLIQEALTVRLDGLQIKVDLLEAKNAENEAKILQQGEEIIKLKAKTNGKQESQHRPPIPLKDERVPRSIIYNKMCSTYSKDENTLDDSLARSATPSSCRDLSLMGHILSGLYLVQNPDTYKIETVFCSFGTSG